MRVWKDIFWVLDIVLTSGKEDYKSENTKKDNVNIAHKEPKGLTEEMINPCAKINVLNTELLDSYNLQCIRRDYRDLRLWI